MHDVGLSSQMIRFAFAESTSRASLYTPFRTLGVDPSGENPQLCSTAAVLFSTSGSSSTTSTRHLKSRLGSMPFMLVLILRLCRSSLKSGAYANNGSQDPMRIAGDNRPYHSLGRADPVMSVMAINEMARR